MKKTLALILVTLLALSATALADDLGVQIIGGNDAPAETLNLDDMQLGETYEIGGYAKVTPLSFAYVDHFPQYDAGHAGDNSTAAHYDDWDGRVRCAYDDYYEYIYWQQSGEPADFAWFLMDVTNMQKAPATFAGETTVKIVYDDEYEYAGWVRSFNFDYDVTRETSRDVIDTEATTIHAAIQPQDEAELGPVYTGHYLFGCTLPNAVINGNEPLKIVVDLGGNELTYNIRK